MINATIEKFGYPQTLIRDFDHWVVLLRPAQVTAGSLILAAKSNATAFGELTPDQFTELAVIVPHVEALLRRNVNFDKINYLMLMMVDPHVHFHIFPRYQGDQSFAGLVIQDSGWPGPPALQSAVKLDAAAIDATVCAMRSPEAF